MSSEILARVIDRKAARSSHVMRWTNKLTNRLEAERILAGWAGLLRDRLDELHGFSQGTLRVRRLAIV